MKFMLTLKSRSLSEQELKYFESLDVMIIIDMALIDRLYRIQGT